MFLKNKKNYIKKLFIEIKEDVINHKFLLFALFILFWGLNKFFYIALKLKGGLINKIVGLFSHIDLFWKISDFPIGINTLIAIAILFVILVYRVLPKIGLKTRKGEEHGSADWGSLNAIKPYIDPTFKNNLLLTQNIRLQYTKPKDIRYARNKNVLVCGGSGTGKTRFFVTPNILQDGRSFVLTDPKGTTLGDVGTFLLEKGYKIKVFNTIDFSKSMKYNPFRYIQNELDVMIFVDAFISNTSGTGQKEDFWVKAEKTLLMALIGFICYECDESEQKISSILSLLELAKPIEGLETTLLDEFFEELEEENPNHFAVRCYYDFKSGAEETKKSILVSLNVRLTPFKIEELDKITEDDEIELDELGDEKTALFFISSDTNKTFNFLGAILYTQLFNILCRKADNFYGGSLPVHVRFILDEFANIGRIPDFEVLIATVRSREISVCPIIQTLSQLKAIYKNGTNETIIGNCDTFLFLGGTDESTLKYVSNFLGQETIEIPDESITYGGNKSSTLAIRKVARKLMTKK